VVVEAFAHAVPAVAPALGVFPDLVRHGETGVLFRPGDLSDLRSQMRRLTDPEYSMRLGAAAGRVYEASFAPERNLEALLSVYQDAIEPPTARQAAGGEERGRR
jgi:glycosyltransferase involved in cell wall biosynthesis